MVGKLLRGITLLIVATRVGSGCGLMMPLLLLSPPTECCMIKLTFYSINKYRQPANGAGKEVDILKPLDIATSGFCSVVQSRVV
uniref:Ubiquitin carboxyl-terminal hydrolase n=1 Tax=Solanum tuberosum TaxID=4113 RepID=M1A945_SOLTU